VVSALQLELSEQVLDGSIALAGTLLQSHAIEHVQAVRTHHMPKRGLTGSDRWSLPAILRQAISLVPREEMCSCV
jgi:hypothetical protein